MRLLLTGASGFAGGEVLRQALDDEAIERVTVLTRRSLGRAHAKLAEVVLDDFLDYGGVALGDHDACIWCLGVSQARVGQAEYVRITHDYTVAAATAMFAANPGLRFCFVSGRNADPDETGRSRQRRIKGRTERSLSTLSENVFHFRPGYIRATARSGPRRDLARYVAPPIAFLLGLVIHDLRIDCDQLARGLLRVAQHGADLHVLDNQAIRKVSARIGIKPRA